MYLPGLFRRHEDKSAGQKGWGRESGEESAREGDCGGVSGTEAGDGV